MRERKPSPKNPSTGRGSSASNPPASGPDILAAVARIDAIERELREQLEQSLQRARNADARAHALEEQVLSQRAQAERLVRQEQDTRAQLIEAQGQIESLKVEFAAEAGRSYRDGEAAMFELQSRFVAAEAAFAAEIAELHGLRADISEAGNREAATIEEIAKLKSLLTSIRTDRDALSAQGAEIDVLSASIAERETAKAVVRSDMQGSQQTGAEIDAANLGLQAALVEAQQAAVDAVQRIEVLEAALRQANALATARQKALEDLTTKLEAHDATHRTQAGEIDDLRQQLDSAGGDITALQDLFNALQEEARFLRNKGFENESRLSAELQRSAALSDELGDVQAAHAGTRATLEQAENDRLRLLDDLTQSRIGAAAAVGRLSEAERRAAELEAANKMLSVKLDQSEEMFRDAMAALGRQGEAQLLALTEQGQIRAQYIVEIARLKEQHEVDSDLLAERSGELNVICDQIQSLEIDNVQLRSEAEAHSRKLSKLETDLVSARNSLENSDVERRTLATALAAHRDELDAARHRAGQFGADLHRSEALCRRLDARLAESRDQLQTILTSRVWQRLEAGERRKQRRWSLAFWLKIIGWNRRPPNPLFDTEYYRQRYLDVRLSPFDPYDHYCRFGSAEGRYPNRMFDPQWYLERYPDVADAGVDPLNHYLASGARELRDPHPLFSTERYLELYPELKNSSINPLLHYLRAGSSTSG